MNDKMKKNISKAIDIPRNFLIKISSNHTDKEMVKKHKDWKKLSNEEKKLIHPNNKYFLEMIKNVYYDWENCSKESFLSNSYYRTNILNRLNNLNCKRTYFTDKNYQPKFLEYLDTPKIIVRKINGDYYNENYEYISLDKALELLNTYSKAVFKISLGSGHGKGVKLVSKEDYKKELEEYGDNFLVQEVIEQHSFLKNFNESSVNIIRVTSLYLDGNVYILSSILRVGAPGAFCDHLGTNGNNPRIVALDDNGNLMQNAIDPDDGFVYKDLFGKKIEGTIPKYDEIIEKIKKEHKKFTHHRIIGWDITIDKNDNVLCIEYNSIFPGIVQSQMVCGPIFAKKSINGVPLLTEILKKKIMTNYI